MLRRIDVTIMPSLQGAAKTIEKELGGVGGSAGKTAGQSWSSAFGSAIGAVGKLAVGTIAGVGAALGGIALKGGIDRALAIENAEAKLTGLGHSADDVSKIMDNALNSVRGTAYGLGDAASVAAGLVAAGVQQGDQLEGVLKTVADTAAISGRSLTDIGLVFQSVAARGKLQGDDMLQLMSSGIPVLQLLSDQLGVTSAEVSEMVSKGEIDFATFAAAMDEGLGGAALKSGETFTGALANVKAALGRLGAEAVTPALASLTTIFAGAIPAIDNLTAGLTPLITDLAERLAPAVEGVATSFFDWMSSIDFSSLSDGLGSVSNLLGPLVGLVGGLSGSFLGGMNIPVVSKLFEGLTGPIGLVVGAIGTLLANSPELRSALGDAFQSIGGALQSLSPLFGVVSSLVGQLAGVLGGVLAQAVNVVAPIIAQIVQLLGPLLTQTLTALTPILMVVANTFGTLLGAALQAIAPLLSELVTALFPILVQVIGAVLPLLAQLVAAIAPLVVTLASALIPIIKALLPVVKTVFSAVGSIIKSVMKVVQGVIKTVTSVIKGDWKGAWEGIKQIFSGIWDVIKSVVRGAINVVKSVITAALSIIKTLWSAAWGAVKDRVTSIWTGIKTGVQNGINGVVGYVRGLKDKVVGAVSGAASWLLNAGRQVVQGFIDGIMAKFNAVKNTLSSLTNLLPDWKGPERRDKTILENAGELVIGGFISGMESQYGAVERTLGRLTSSLAGSAPAVVAGGSGSGGPQIQQIINPQPGQSEQQIGDMAARRLTFAMQGA